MPFYSAGYRPYVYHPGPDNPDDPGPRGDEPGNTENPSPSPIGPGPGANPVAPPVPIDPNPTPTPEPAPAPGGGGRGGGGGGGGGYTGPISPDYNFAPIPHFTPPIFTPPSIESAYADPGYQFRLAQGTNALQNAAAAKGILRTGGSLKDLIEYGQKFGAQEYNDVFNRTLQGYDRTYQGAKDAYAPQLAEWQTRAQAEAARALAQYDRQWQMYQFNHRGGGGPSQESLLAQELALLGPAPSAPPPYGA